MIKKILIFLIPIMLFFAYGFKPHDKPTGKTNNGNIPYRILNNQNQVLAVDSKKLQANLISTWFRTNGSFNRDPSTGNSGFEWPKGQSKFARYASGIWIGAVVGNDTLIAMAEYDYEYLPGNIPVIGGEAVGRDDPNYKIFNISATDSSEYPAWRTFGSQQGAYLDSLGNPFLMGSQTQFYTYTDGYPDAHGNNAGSTRPLKAVILQTNWSYSGNGPLNNMSFSEFRIINRGDQPWTKCFIAVWTDDDLGSATDDAVGVDTLLNLGFTFNATNSDPSYGVAPPAVGFDYFRGPIVPDPDSTFSYFSPPGSNNLIVKPGFKQLGLSAFNMYSNGNPSIGDPSNFRETYFNLQGLRRDGSAWVTPGGQTTTFAFSGDPETGAGWVLNAGEDRRFMQCSGPITVNSGDTQNIVISQIITRGENNLKSVTALKGLSRAAQRIFDNNFQVPSPPACPVTKAYAPGNGKIYLTWNDAVEKITIPNKLSGGTYRFQGYNVYAIRVGTDGSNEADRQLIATYDLRDGIGDIKDSIFVERYGTYVFTVVQTGSNNGISRYIVIDKDNISNEFLVSGTPYKFAVTAYLYDPRANLESNLTNKVNESPISSCAFTVTPQALTSGSQINYGVGDTIDTDQRDLGVMPIITEPLELVSATYTSTIGGTLGAPSFTLTRTLNGSTSTLVENDLNFTGEQDTAKTINGFLLVHQTIKDSGIVRDPENGVLDTTGKNFHTRERAWTYDPPGNAWFTGPDTTAVKTAKIITNRQFDSRSLGMSFPTLLTFRNTVSRVKANGNFFQQLSATSPILSGGPLRKIQIVFGQNSQSYRYVPTDTTYVNTPGAPEMVTIPFSVYAVDELDSSGGTPRQLNVGFMDADLDGTWNPNSSLLGGYHFTYIFASDYSATPNTNYTSKNPGLSSPGIGFPSLDVMYAWLPRVKSVNGVNLMWSNGDKLTVSPYRITKPNFVPGYPIKYTWKVDGSQIGNQSIAAGELGKIKAFPNPYFGGSRLETDPFDRFIYFSHLPIKCDIYIYTLDGVLVRKLTRNNNDPNNSLEKWDLQNSNSIPVASGMYIVYIDAGSIGVTTLKVAIFSPTERIQTF
ncbi:MAG: T9SS type A sorting domain-containing protein [Ignavibacteria bacterium]